LIANATNRANKRAVIAGVDFAAEIVDVDIDDIGHGVKIEFPHLLDDRGARNGLALMAHEEFEEGELLGAEIDRMAPALDDVGNTIDF
jgi:hypothetical protein